MFGLDNLFQMFAVGFAIVLVIPALMTPAFVMQIRDAAKRIDKKMSTIISRR